MSYSPREKCFTYNMDINKCNTQECNLNKSGIKVDNISVVERSRIVLDDFVHGLYVFNAPRNSTITKVQS